MPQLSTRNSTQFRTHFLDCVRFMSFFVISDELKAKEILFDVGYFRMGFYWFI